jgi:hypothetical protein
MGVNEGDSGGKVVVMVYQISKVRHGLVTFVEGCLESIVVGECSFGWVHCINSSLPAVDGLMSIVTWMAGDVVHTLKVPLQPTVQVPPRASP